MAEEGLLGAGGSSFDRQDLDGGGEYANVGCIVHAVRTLKKPHVILRLVSLVFCIIVSASISGHAWTGNVCKFNNGSGVCNYATSIGILACCGLVLFLVVDFLFDLLRDVLLRRLIVIADMFFFGLFSIVWFTCFCYLADAWRKTSSDKVVVGGGSLQASIAFSFFNIGTFAALAAVAYVRYSDGIADDFTFGFISSRPVATTPSTHSTYSSLPSSSGPIQPTPYTSLPPPGGHQPLWMPRPTVPTSRAQSTYEPLSGTQTNTPGQGRASQHGESRASDNTEPKDVAGSSLLGGGGKTPKYDSGRRDAPSNELAAGGTEDSDTAQLLSIDGYQR